MRELALSPWLVLQLLLGVALVAIPVAVTGLVALMITVPIYSVVMALTLVREVAQSKRQHKANAVHTLNVLVSDLSTLAQGGGGGKHWALLQDLRANPQFRAQMETCGNEQAGRLLDERCRRLFSDVRSLVGDVRLMDGSTADQKLRNAVIEFRRLLEEYYIVVREFLQFLEDTKGEKETIQDKSPFSSRIHRDLADGYDRMMDTARQARDVLRAYVGHDWLPDELLIRFPREALFA